MKNILIAALQKLKLTVQIFNTPCYLFLQTQRPIWSVVWEIICAKYVNFVVLMVLLPVKIMRNFICKNTWSLLSSSLGRAFSSPCWWLLINMLQGECLHCRKAKTIPKPLMANKLLMTACNSTLKMVGLLFLTTRTSRSLFWNVRPGKVRRDQLGKATGKALR